MSAPVTILHSFLAALALAAPSAGCSLLLDSDEFGGPAAAADAAAPPASDPGGGGAPDAEPSSGEGDDEDDAAPPADAAPAPVDAAGNYTVSVTSGENGCGFAGWQEGATTTGVPLTVTQQDGAVTAAVEGAIGLFLDAVLGSRAFQGEAAGAALELTLFGTTPFTSGACTYTVNGVVVASLDGDVLEGEIEYRPSTNGSPDCGALETCASAQRFNGTRPPP